jgi:putative alpha-1,2-mannosidase
MDTMYGTGPAGLCGNDDAGQMSAWYIFSALGFYPVTPGSTRYELGSPLVENAVVHLENGRTLEIRTRNQAPENVFVRRVTVDGQPLDRRHLTHDELVRGSVIEFEMAPDPSR